MTPVGAWRRFSVPALMIVRLNVDKCRHMHKMLTIILRLSIIPGAA